MREELTSFPSLSFGDFFKTINLTLPEVPFGCSHKPFSIPLLIAAETFESNNPPSVKV